MPQVRNAYCYSLNIFSIGVKFGSQIFLDVYNDFLSSSSALIYRLTLFL